MENNEIMENEIMENEDVNYEVEEVSQNRKGNGAIIAGVAVGAAALVGAGTLAYKKLIKPNIAKAKVAIAERKVKKNQDKIEKKYTEISEEEI